ncbi:MAG: hypothetical protein Q9162_002131 [Coniocarpon cinnabarinum]
MGSRLEANSNAVRKRIENHDFDNEEGEEYEPSKFGGFPEYFRRKKIKLQNLDAQIRSENDDKPYIFRGIVAHINGYTQPSLNDLHVLIVTHGGGFIQYLDGKTQVTHIIASNLTPKKVEDFRKYRIVKPAWIVDSVQTGALLPWENYRVVDEGAKQKVLKFDDGHITSQVNNKKAGYRDQTDASWYTKQLRQDDGTPHQDLRDPEIGDYDFPSSAILSDDGKPNSELSSSNALKIRKQDGNASVEASVSTSSHAARDECEAEDTEAVHRSRSEGRKFQASPVAGTNLEPGGGGDNDTNAESNELSHVVHPQRLTANGFLEPDQDVTPLKRKNSDESPQAEKRARMTAEDHNRELLSDPRIRKSSVLDPDFLEQYYRESRLHHLSTWKADLKSQLQALTSEKTASQKAKQKRAPNSRRYILHVDFDSFFVAVSLKNYPQFQDKPAVVAHGAGSGSEIASCNYPARKYGVKNGMWMKRAQEMCEDLKVLPYDFPAYEAASRLFYDAIMATGGIVQSVSIDEALVDISVECHSAGGTDGTGVREGSIWREQAKANDIAQSLRDQVKRESGCAVSVGIGGNILLAKVALRKAKPAGQHQIKPEEVLDFTGGLEVQSLPGVAYSIGGKLEDIGVKYVKDIRDLNKERLVSVLGPKTGEKIWNYSRGIDRTEVGDQVVRKSVSAEVNWGVRFETSEQVDEFMVSLSGELSRRLVKEGVKGRNLTMKVMRRSKDAPMDPPKHLGHGKCDIYNKSVVLGVLTNEKDTISKETISMLRGLGFSPGELRGLGIQMTKLEPVKTSVSGKNDGSQRLLRFDVAPAPQIPQEDGKTSAREDHKVITHTMHTASLPHDEAESGRRQSRPGSQFQTVTNHHRKPQPTENDDIQDDPETPKRPRLHGVAGVAQAIEDSPSRGPLNTTGTQFILPTQVDPSVLVELPADVRAKLQQRIPKQGKQPPLKLAQAIRNESTAPRPFAFTALPNQSQIDPAILDALPKEVRREILSQYQKSPSKAQTQRGQAVLPQSPRKNRTVKSVATTRGRTRGRPRGGSLLARLKGVSSRNNPTLTQANFVAAHAESDSDAGSGDIAADFLEALPEDVRAEVIENHKREQRKRSGGIEVSRRRRGLHTLRGLKKGIYDQVNGERVLRLEAPPPRPTFTQSNLSRLDELREAISSWHEEFQEDGPYQEDVDALNSYLSQVVMDEGDMRKAVDVVKWLAHVIDYTEDAVRSDSSPSSRRSQDAYSWAQAVESVKGAVNESVRLRGLGSVNYDV